MHDSEAASCGAGSGRPLAAPAWRRRYATLAAMDRRRGRRTAGMTTDAALERYEAVIGIEVHCQLRTASKMFCGCSTDYDGAPPNTPRLPGLPGPARARCRRSTGGPSSTSSRPALAIEATRPGGDPLGPQELLLPGPAQGLPDQPVRPAARVARPADVRDVRRARSRSAITRAHLEEDTAKLVHATGRRRAARSASSTSTARARR